MGNNFISIFFPFNFYLFTKTWIYFLSWEINTSYVHPRGSTSQHLVGVAAPTALRMETSSTATKTRVLKHKMVRVMSQEV